MVEHVNSQQRPTLGVVVICRNEEQDVAGFLSHLLGWVDEIVIVDDGSTDHTSRRVAEMDDSRIRFVESPRAEGEYFSHQRNKGIGAASSDWLLHLDMDERVLPELSKEILQAICDSRKDVYRLHRLNFFMHRPMRGGGWQYWNHPHLARRESLRFSGMFHEQCEFEAAPDRVGQIVHPLWHLNDRSYCERMQKSLRYSGELIARLKRRVPCVRWYHILFLPFAEWFRKFVWLHGYRDGTCGLILAGHSASALFRACVLLWEEQHSIDRGELERQVADAWNQWKDDPQA